MLAMCMVVASIALMGAWLLPDSVPVCGFWTPGRSDLWDEQVRATFALDDTKDVYWRIYDSGTVVKMQTFQAALAVLDSGGTTVTEADADDQWHRLKLHANKVPYVSRRFSAPLHSTRDDLVKGADVFEGNAKPVEEGYVPTYFAKGEKDGMSLAEFFDEERNHVSSNASRRWYWVACHQTSTDARWSKVPTVWEQRLVHRLLAARDIFPGIKLPISACVRIAATSTRMNMHADPQDNFLYQVLGERKVLLAMPDMGYTVYPRVNARIFEDGYRQSEHKATVDPRNINYTVHPAAHNGRFLTATLRPGDVLYIPSSWWHYIEAAPHGNVSLAANLFLGYFKSESEERNFISHPCDPDDWSFLKKFRYHLLSTWQ